MRNSLRWTLPFQSPDCVSDTFIYFCILQLLANFGIRLQHLERVHPVCGCHLLMFLNVPFTLALCLSHYWTELNVCLYNLTITASSSGQTRFTSAHSSSVHPSIHPERWEKSCEAPFSIICSPALKLKWLIFSIFSVCFVHWKTLIFFRMGKWIQTATIRRKSVVRITSKCKAALKQHLIYTEQRRHQMCVWYWEIRSERLTVLQLSNEALHWIWRCQRNTLTLYCVFWPRNRKSMAVVAFLELLSGC